MKRVAPFLLPLLLLTTVCAEDLKPEERIAAQVQKELDADLFPGVVVVFGNREKVLYLEAFGFAQVTPTKLVMRKDSIFDVASITKPVCAGTAIAICKDRGLVDPDAPLTKYLPDHTGKGVEKISLRRLASHTSGFTEQPGVNRGGKLKGDALFAALLKESPKFEVNTHYEYADRNIILLSMIVERVSGKSFGDFCKDEIFTPLQMKDSAFNRIEGNERAVATHHEVLGECHNDIALDAGRAIGHAGLFISGQDLANFCTMMLNGGKWGGKQIISAETVADFTALNQLPEFKGHGFVWEIDSAALHRPQRMSAKAYGHSGNTGISVWLDPEKGVYGVVLTNRNHPGKVIGNRTGMKEPKNTPRGIQQSKSRGRIVDAAMEAFGY